MYPLAMLLEYSKIRSGNVTDIPVSDNNCPPARCKHAAYFGKGVIVQMFHGVGTDTD